MSGGQLGSIGKAMPLTGMGDPRQSVRGPGMMPGIAPGRMRTFNPMSGGILGGSIYDRMRRGSLSDALSRMRERISQGNRGRPPGMPRGRFFPGGPGIPPRRSPGGPFGPGDDYTIFIPPGQGPTRRMPPQLDPSKGRAGMDRIMDRLRGTRNPMDRMSPSRSRSPTPIDFTPSNFLGNPRGPMQPRPQDIQPEIRQTPIRQQIPPRGMQEGGEVNPLDDLYAQIGVTDENTAREVIEKILSGQSADLSEEQQGLLGGGVYRRIANRLGMRDRAGNLITPISGVETGYGKTEAPDSQQALRNLLDMEKTEGGTGIETLLNYLQGRRRPREAAEGQEPEATGPFGLVDFASGGPQFPGPQFPSPGGGYPLYPQPPVFGEVSMPSIPQSPFLPYAGMANPMNPNIFGGYGYGFGPSMGMAPMNYYGGFQPPPGVFGEKTGEGGDVDPDAMVVTNT